MNNRYILIFIFLFFGLSLSAQNVTNVNAYQEGRNIIINYHLDKEADIKIQVSTDGGRNYSQPLKKVSGDVGQGVNPGNKRIIWNALSEFENFGGDHIVFKVSPIMASKVRFQNDFSVGAGWIGAGAGGVSTSIMPLSVTYVAGLRIGHIFMGAGAGLGYNMATVSAEAAGSALKANVLSIELNGSLRYYLLKSESRINPYLSASVIYGLGKESSFDQSSNTHKVSGTMKTGGLMWAASAGSAFRLGKKSAFSVSLGMRSFNLDYSYSATELASSSLTKKLSHAKMFVPTLSLGFTF